VRCRTYKIQAQSEVSFLMYCPKCGQEIVSNDLRFCPRCGLSLAVVSGLLSGNDVALRVETPPTGLSIFRRKEYRLAAQLVFFSIIAVPVSLIFSIVFDSPGPLVVPLLMFLAGLAKLTYTFLFGKGKPSEAELRRQFQYSDQARLEEPRLYISPTENYAGTTTTELIKPPSVTEKTTNLLKEN
jgi:hypothetical protein